MMGCVFSDPSIGGHFGTLSSGDAEDLASKMKKYRLLQLKRRGIKEWQIDGFIVFARDRENAERKARNAREFLNQNRVDYEKYKE